MQLTIGEYRESASNRLPVNSKQPTLFGGHAMTLEEEKAKLKFEHQLAVKRLVLEKLALGILIIGLGYLANLAIEQYKAAEAIRQFLLQKRFEAITESRARFSQVTHRFYQITKLACANQPIDDEKREALGYEVELLINKLNDSAVLFGNDYESGIKSVVNIFSGFSTKAFRIECEHRYFGSDVANYFTNINKAVLGVDAPLKRTSFAPIKMTASDIDSIGVEEYTMHNFLHWKERSIGN